MPNGTITAWKDHKGFGYIRPDKGGSNIFVHITDLRHRGYRPQIGDRVRFSVGQDDRGRKKAAAVTILGIPRYHRDSPWSFALVVPAVFLGILIGADVGHFVVAGYLTMSAATWFAYSVDKRRARADAWRTPESTLHILALLGGWPGAVLAQQALRHKTRKLSFQAVFWLTASAHIAFWAYLWIADLLPEEFVPNFLRTALAN